MKTSEESIMTKKSPHENNSSQNSPVNLSKMKERKCIQPAVLALRTAALQERPPTPTPDSSSSLNIQRGEPFLAPIYIPNKIMTGQISNKPVATSISQPQRHSTTRIREVNPIAKAESRENTYRHSKGDMALPAVDHISLPKLSNEDVKVPKRASFLPRIDQTTQQTLTGLKHGSLHAISQHERQLYGIKRSPLGRLEGNNIGSEIRLPTAKSKHKSHTHKKLHKSDSNQKTASTSATPSSRGSAHDVKNSNTLVEHAPKPPSLPKTCKTTKHPRKHHKAKKVDSKTSPSNDENVE